MNLLLAVLIAYAAVAAGIALFQRRLMYHPSKQLGAPAEYGLPDMRDITLTSKDGTTQLHAWVQPARTGFPTIVYFHGNAGNIGDRSAKFRAMVANGFGLIALSYRGFGKSEGTPTEQGIYNDARAIVDYALTKAHIPPGKLIYYGESLGSGVAVTMAGEKQPALLALEAAYMSVAKRSAEMFPYIMFAKLLVRDKYDSFTKIRGVHCPLLMLHGDEDSTIPLRHGRALFEIAHEPKSMLVYKGIHHTDYTDEQIISPLMNTAKQYRLI